MRVDTSSLISGAIVCGDRGLGVLGSTILADTATGDHGTGYLYNDVDSGDEAKEFRGLIVTPPSAGAFFAFEDGSFSLIAPDGSYTFVYRLYVDGVDLGTATASVTIGATSTASLSVTTDAAVFSGSAGVGTDASLAIYTNSSTFAGSAFCSPIATLSTTTSASVFSGSATSTAPGSAHWPDPAQVLAGITYGPTGADYTGIAAIGTGTTIVDAISFVVNDQIVMGI